MSANTQEDSLSVDENCAFLTMLPLEIRLNIYRYLLLPYRMTSMIPLDTNSNIESDTEDEWTDSEDSGSESELDSDLEQMIRKEEEYEESMKVHPRDFRRHHEILRVNKQIHEEASTVLYNEGIIVVEPGDIFCLRKTPHNLPFGARHKGVWRHNPLKGTGKKVAHTVVYDTPELDGRMEPHVFARFRRVHFDACFDLQDTQNVELWIDDETHIVRQDSANKYMEVLRSSRVIKDLVKVLRNSPQILTFEMSLEVEVMANSNLMMEYNDVDDDSEEDDVEVEEKIDKVMDIANERATELFLDSGICDRFLRLSNVMSFGFSFDFSHRLSEDPYVPSERHLQLVKDTKARIESNSIAAERSSS